jgi:peptidyl-prolyl cis-trans isomerase B (cyclophilin B)
MELTMAESCLVKTLVLLVVAAAFARPATGQEPGSLDAPQLYCGDGRPIPISVKARDGRNVELVLLDALHETLAGPTEIRTRSVDLTEVMPEGIEAMIARGEAAWLQLLVDNEPVGAPLVVQPMLTRLVPDTRRRLDPRNNQMRTFIDGWVSEHADDEPPVEPTAPEVESAATDARADSRATDEESPRRLCSGFRVYTDADVRLETSRGEMLIGLRPDAAPNTAWNFRHLVGGSFYDGVTFHRIVPRDREGEPFVIQGGDPLGTGYGGPGYWLPIEPSGLLHGVGIVSMARADDPDSAGSQFFVCLSRAGTARLDGQYCPFAQIVAGLDIVKAIAEVELEDVATGRPIDPPVIHRATLVASPPRTPGEPRVYEEPKETVKPSEEPKRVPR